LADLRDHRDSGPACPMLIGSLPVILIILPCCISAAFLIKADEEAPNFHQNRSIADISLLLSVVFSGGFNMMAAYFVQSAIAKAKEEMDEGDWIQDLDEAAVLEAVEAEKQLQEEYDVLTDWHKADHPAAVKVILVLGSLFASATMFILVNPVHKAFDKFSLTDKVSDLQPNGSVLDVVHPAGFASMATLAITCGLLGAYQAWCTWATSPSKRLQVQLQREMKQSQSYEVRTDAEDLEDPKADLEKPDDETSTPAAACFKEHAESWAHKRES